MTSGEDLASADEVKVYDDEGDEEGKSSEENLTEDKIGLVTETEEEQEKEPEESTRFGDTLESAFPRFPFHPAFPPFLYPYPGLPGRLGPLSPSLYMYGKDKLPIPPPAHMGHPPRLPLYGLPPTGPPGLFPFYPPDFSHWGPLSKFPPLSPSMIPGGHLLPGSPGSSFVPLPGFMAPSPSHMSQLRSPDAKRKSESSPGLSHQSSRHPASLMREDNSPFRNQMFFTPNRSQSGLLTTDSPHFYPGGFFSGGFNGVLEKNQRATPKKPVIKKPLNAFMLFMKEMRQSVIEECTLKESAAINQILGRKWHALDRSEQAKYYEMAKKEKELHAQKYPGWSARDNYAMSSKKKKRRLENQDSTASSDSDSSRPSKQKNDSKSFTNNVMRELSVNGDHHHHPHNHHNHRPFSPISNDYSRSNNMSLTSL